MPLAGACRACSAQEIGDLVVVIGQRRDAPADRVQLDSFLGHFGDVAVRLQKLQPLDDLAEAMGVEAADHRVHRQHQVRVPLLQRLQLRPRLHGKRPVALDAANVVVFVANAVQAQVDADARLGALLAHALDHLHDAVGEHAVGGDGDDFGTALLVGANDQFVQVLAQEGLAAGEGHVEGRTAQAGEDRSHSSTERSSLGLRHTSQVRHLLLQRKLTLITTEKGLILGQPKVRNDQ